MTFVTGCFYRECSLAVMTGSAGTAALHLSHRKALCTFTSRKDTVVALATLEQPGMKFVAENCRAGLLDLIFDLFGGFVTTVTIPLDRKSQETVMAGATGSVLLHFAHCITLVVAVRGKEGVVTVTAAVHFKMSDMGEFRISSKLNLLYRMTTAAILGY